MSRVLVRWPQGYKKIDAYEICEMDVTIRVQEDIVWLDITMYDTLAMYVSQSAAQFGDPKSHGLLCEGLSGNVET